MSAALNAVGVSGSSSQIPRNDRLNYRNFKLDEGGLSRTKKGDIILRGTVDEFKVSIKCTSTGDFYRVLSGPRVVLRPQLMGKADLKELMSALYQPNKILFELVDTLRSAVKPEPPDKPFPGMG